MSDSKRIMAALLLASVGALMSTGALTHAASAQKGKSYFCQTHPKSAKCETAPKPIPVGGSAPLAPSAGAATPARSTRPVVAGLAGSPSAQAVNALPTTGGAPGQPGQPFLLILFGSVLATLGFGIRRKVGRSL
jgi:hypothetical protein